MVFDTYYPEEKNNSRGSEDKVFGHRSHVDRYQNDKSTESGKRNSR